MTVTSLMDPYQFGAELIRTKDLDPVYVVVYESGINSIILKQWMLAYWCFYHAGTACWVSEGGDFWGRMAVAAGSKDYPRGRERRHFRGKLATNSVVGLYDLGMDRLFGPFDSTRLTGKTVPVRDVMKIVQAWPGFGPWIAFKVADMLERLYGVDVYFDRIGELLYESPRKGAELMWGLYPGAEILRHSPPSDVAQWAVNTITAKLFPYYNAPPSYNRPVNAQEAETILCKWKAYRDGNYRIGEDCERLRKSLMKFPYVRLAQIMLKAGKESKLW